MKQSIEFVSEYPYLLKLVQDHGQSGAGKIIGLNGSSISGMLRDKKVRPAYEMAAELHYRNTVPREDRTTCAFLITLTPEQKRWIMPLFEAQKIEAVNIAELVS